MVLYIHSFLAKKKEKNALGEEVIIPGVLIYIQLKNKLNISLSKQCGPLERVIFNNILHFLG